MTTASELKLPDSVDAVIALLATENYLCDRRLATALFLALKLRRPLFLEGEPGVGKTELAKSLSSALGTLMLRVQCYEGLDVAQTAYEWNVARQMVEIRLAEAAHSITDAADRDRLAHSLYSRAMLIERPLLQALTQARSPVLLIDELDRADEPFDAFLLEVDTMTHLLSSFLDRLVQEEGIAMPEGYRPLSRLHTNGNGPAGRSEKTAKLAETLA